MYRILPLLLLALLTACDQSPAPTPNATSAAEARPVVALVMKTLTNPFFVAMERGARQAEQELDIELRVKTAAQETSIEQQIQIVDSLVRAGVDAIVIAPGDSLELIPVLKQAQDAGVVVVNIDNRLDPELSAKLGLKGVPYISVDNTTGAYGAAKALAEALGGRGEVAILEGIQSASNAGARLRGAQQAFAESPGITVVASETAHWKIDEGYQVTARLMTAHPEIRGLFCANDMMALGALRYLQEQGRTEVKVAGFDNLPEVAPALREGRLVATVDQQATRQGYLGVRYAVLALRGEKLPPVTLVDTQLVTGEPAPPPAAQ